MSKLSVCLGTSAFLLLSSGLQSAVFHVSPSGNRLASGVDWQFSTTLRHALERAQAGDEIWLMEGTYFPADAADVDARFVLPGGVALYGGFAGSETERDQRDHEVHPTILSGDFGQDDQCPHGAAGLDTVTIVGTNAEVIVQSIDEVDVVLDGLTITGANGFTAINAAHSSMELRNLTVVCNVSNGSGAGCWGTECSLLFENVIFARNRAANPIFDGGAVALDQCEEVVISGCNFQYNDAAGLGGGLFAFNPGELSVINSTFMSNTSHDGGGLAVNGGTIAVSSCRFFANETNEGGGGIFAGGCDSLHVAESSFLRNEADRGGGCRVDDCAETWFDRVRFVGNESAEAGGGGLYVTGFAPLLTDVEFTRNFGDEDSGGLQVERAAGTTTVIGGTFSGNVRGAIFVRLSGPLSLMNVTVTNNTGPGGFSTGTVTVEGSDVILLNTIVWETEFGEVELQGGTLDASHSNVGEFDPRFVNPVLAGPGPDNTWGTTDDILPDLRLQEGSDSIDAGIDYALMPEVDMQGLSRVLGSAIDQGAFEFTEDPAGFDRDGDGVPDVEETIAGTSIIDPRSFFALSFENASTPGPLGTVSWTTVAGRRYLIECSPNLLDWIPVFEHLAAESGGPVSYSKPIGDALFLRGRVSVAGTELVDP